MVDTNKVIITCAVTGSIHTPTMSPHLPITPDEIADASIGAWEAGASIIHLHARNPEDGSPTPDPDVFMEFLPRVKQATDAVVNISTGGGHGMTVQQRLEAAVKAKLAEEHDKIVEHFAKETLEKIEVAKADLSEDVNGTVNYAVTQWLEENQLAVDRGIKNEITEDFIAGLKNLFEEHYISIPSEKEDVVESMAEQIREMESRLDEQV